MRRQRASRRRACHRGRSPTHWYRGLDAASLWARAARSGSTAAPAWTSVTRDSAGSSRAAMAARNGSFTGRRCASWQTSNARRRSGCGPGTGSADWTMTRVLPRTRSGSRVSASGWRITTRLARSSERVTSAPLRASL